MIGTLLGSISDGVVEVKNCYAVPHSESNEQVRAEAAAAVQRQRGCHPLFAAKFVQMCRAAAAACRRGPGQPQSSALAAPPTSPSASPAFARPTGGAGRAAPPDHGAAAAAGQPAREGGGLVLHGGPRRVAQPRRPHPLLLRQRVRQPGALRVACWLALTLALRACGDGGSMCSPVERVHTVSRAGTEQANGASRWQQSTAEASSGGTVLPGWRVTPLPRPHRRPHPTAGALVAGHERAGRPPGRARLCVAHADHRRPRAGAPVP